MSLKREFMQRFLMALCLVFFLSCNNESKVQLTKATHHHQKIDESISKNQEIDSFISPYRKRIKAEMNTVLSKTDQSMFKADAKFNTAIGNMMADATFELTQPIIKKRHQIQLDGVLLNFGGIRSGISAGDITTKTAYDIMPFENEVVVAELKAEQMQQLFNYLAEEKKAHPIAGLQLELDENGTINKALIQEKEIDTSKTYFIATSDYLIDGGDRMNFFLDAVNLYSTDYKLRNLFIDYFKSKEIINPKRDRRFIQK
ncbi:MAG: 5'-nucleotidase C-terminal domain-containing protein [Bacteroidota bacterium]